jgi:hypothetical protein
LTSDASTTRHTGGGPADDPILRLIDDATRAHRTASDTGDSSGTTSRGTTSRGTAGSGRSGNTIPVPDGMSVKVISMCGHDHSSDDEDPTGLRAALMLRVPGNAFWERGESEKPPPHIAAVLASMGLDGDQAAIQSDAWYVRWYWPNGSTKIGFTPTGETPEGEPLYDVAVTVPGGGAWPMSGVTINKAMNTLETLGIFTMPTPERDPAAGSWTGLRAALARRVPPTTHWEQVKPDIAKLVSNFPQVWAARWSTSDGIHAIGLGPALTDGDSHSDNLFSVMVTAPTGTWRFNDVTVEEGLTALELLGVIAKKRTRPTAEPAPEPEPAAEPVAEAAAEPASEPGS